MRIWFRKASRVLSPRWILDFGTMFKLIEGKGFRGNYTNAFGTLDDMRAARQTLVHLTGAAGVRT